MIKQKRQAKEEREGWGGESAIGILSNEPTCGTY